MVRSSLRYVGWQERKRVARDLRTIYSAPTLEAGEHALEAFCQQWDARFPVIGKQWRRDWAYLSPLFAYPAPIRKVIYTTNAVESLNAQLRKVTKKKGAFPTAEAVRKVLYLALQRASARWTRPIADWRAALTHFAIVFEGRVPL